MTKIERAWRLTDFEEARAGMKDAADLRAVDENGMPMAFAAALDSATMAGLIIGLVDMAREGGGESAVDELRALMREAVSLLRVQVEQQRALLLLLSSRERRAEAMRLRDLEDAGALGDDPA